MTPPDPTRIRSGGTGIIAISTGGLVAATAGMLWCSATQYRWMPTRSAETARSIVAARACPVV